MKQISILALFFLVLLFNNCDNNYTTCDETKFDLGEILLEDSTKNLFYQNDDTLVFKNSLNNELRFIPTSSQNSIISMERTEPCENFHISYSVQSISQTFTSENSQIQIFISAKPWYTLLRSPIVSPSQDLGFYDNFFTKIEVLSTQDTSDIRLMAAYRNQNILHSFLVTVADYFDEPQNQTINGIMYNDVYVNERSSGLHYYFSKENKIIAFRKPDDGSIWMLDRID